MQLIKEFKHPKSITNGSSFGKRCNWGENPFLQSIGHLKPKTASTEILSFASYFDSFSEVMTPIQGLEFVLECGLSIGGLRELLGTIQPKSLAP